MKNDNHISRLPNAPLQEVIFEALWEIEFDPSGNPIDPNFELAQGVFANLIKKEFPFRRRTIPQNIPINIYPKPIHQFWKSENNWPVIQIGPGILAVNDIDENYHWEKSFRKNIEFAVENLKKSYENNLKFIKLSLRYIDAIELPDLYAKKDINTFINENFNLKVNNNFSSIGRQTGININQVFLLQDGSKLNFIISNGTSKNSKPSIIWQTNVYINSDPIEIEILKWLDSAHEITSSIFKNTITDEFYNSFK